MTLSPSAQSGLAARHRRQTTVAEDRRRRRLIYLSDKSGCCWGRCAWAGCEVNWEINNAVVGRLLGTRGMGEKKDENAELNDGRQPRWWGSSDAITHRPLYSYKYWPWDKSFRINEPSTEYIVCFVKQLKNRKQSAFCCRSRKLLRQRQRWYGVEGVRSGAVAGSPPGASFRFRLREALQSQTHTEKILHNERR